MKAPFQYQGHAEPLPSGPPPVIPPLSWAPEFVDRCLPKAGLSAAILAGAFFFLLPQVSYPQTTGATQGSPQVRAGRQIQYTSTVRPFYFEVPAPTDVSTAVVAYPVEQRQYVSQVAPFQAALTPPAAVTIEWLPDYPDRVARVRPLLLGGSAELPSSARDLGQIGWQGWTPDLLNRRVAQPWLWPSLSLDPFPRPDATAFFAAYYPDWLTIRRAQPASGSVEPPYSVRELGHVGWLPTYQDYLFRLQVRAVDQRAAFTPDYLPLADLRWAPSYPDRVVRAVVRAVDQQAFFTGVTSSVVSFDHLGWSPRYPDKLWALPRLAEYPAVFTGQTGSTIPYGDLRWAAVYPDRIVRLQPTPWLWPALEFDPFPLPNAAAPTLSWQGSYPNWLNRRILPVALIQFIDVRNLEPIPNPPVVGGQDLTLGVEIGLTSFPVLGGWVPF